MENEKIVIIHTGFHKAGSSSLQHSLAYNRSLLEESGYHYPDIMIDGVQFYNCSVPLYGRYSDNPDQFQHYWLHNELNATFANKQIDSLFENELWKKDKLIFSDEFISSLNPEELRRLRDDFVSHGYKIRAVTYVRDPLNLIVSVVQQQSRRRSINETLKVDRGSKEVTKIQKIIDVFGNDAEFYNFENICTHEVGPVGFFFDLIGVSLPENKARRINEGMSSNSVRLLSFINNQAPQVLDGKVNPIRRKLDVQPLSVIEGKKFKLSAEEFEVVRPDLEASKYSISKILGKDFFPESKVEVCDGVVWNEGHIEYLISVSRDLDLHMLLRVYDFLRAVEFSGVGAVELRDKFTVIMRDRLDRELLSNKSFLSEDKIKKNNILLWVLKRFRVLT